MAISKHLIACTLALSVVFVPLAEADWLPFESRYAVYRNGKLVGKADVRLEKQGDKWVLNSEGGGTHGLGRLLGVSDSEYVEGHFLEGRFWPVIYRHHTRVAGINREWTANFNWSEDSVDIIKGKRTVTTMGLEESALDGLSLKLEIQRRLRDGDPDEQFYLVDDDEIKPQIYRVVDTEQLETSLGCYMATEVERVRTGSTRYTRAWHVPELDYLTVRMEHGKTDGDKMELRITELVLNGKPIQPRAGCIGVQLSSGRP